MRSFVVYTAARVLLFAAAWAVVWLVASVWLEWTSLTALWTALIAMVVSSLASYPLLGGLRQRLADDVQARAGRIQQRYDSARRREDPDGH